MASLRYPLDNLEKFNALKDFSGIMGSFSGDNNQNERQGTPARLMNISTIDYNKQSSYSASSPKLPSGVRVNCEVSPHPISSSRSPAGLSGQRNSLTFNEGDVTQSIGTYIQSHPEVEEKPRKKGLSTIISHEEKSSQQYANTSGQISKRYMVTNEQSTTRHYMNTNEESSNKFNTNEYQSSSNHYMNTNEERSKQYMNTNEQSSKQYMNTNENSSNHYLNINDQQRSNHYLNTNEQSSNHYMNTNENSSKQFEQNSKQYMNTHEQSSKQYMNTNEQQSPKKTSLYTHSNSSVGQHQPHSSLNVLSNSSLGYQQSSTERSYPDQNKKQPCYQEVYVSTDEKDPYKYPAIVQKSSRPQSFMQGATTQDSNRISVKQHLKPQICSSSDRTGGSVDMTKSNGHFFSQRSAINDIISSQMPLRDFIDQPTIDEKAIEMDSEGNETFCSPRVKETEATRMSAKETEQRNSQKISQKSLMNSHQRQNSQITLMNQRQHSQISLARGASSHRVNPDYHDSSAASQLKTYSNRNTHQQVSTYRSSNKVSIYDEAPDRHVINGYEIINVNASNPQSLINSGRLESEKILSPINNVSMHHNIDSYNEQCDQLREQSFVNLLNQSSNVGLKPNLKQDPKLQYNTMGKQANKHYESEYLQNKMAEIEKKSYESEYMIDESNNTKSYLSGTLGATGASQFQMLDSKALGTSNSKIFANNDTTLKNHQVRPSGVFPTLGDSKNINIEDNDYAYVDQQQPRDTSTRRNDTSSFRKKINSIEYSETIETNQKASETYESGNRQQQTQSQTKNQYSDPDLTQDRYQMPVDHENDETQIFDLTREKYLREEKHYQTHYESRIKLPPRQKSKLSDTNERIYEKYGIQLDKKNKHHISLRSNSQTQSVSKVLDTPTSSKHPQPLMVEILKQELLSAKRQITDQQSSNQFLKKENLKVEHEKNMLQITISQKEEIIAELEGQLENINELLENETENFNNQNEEQKSYIEGLQNMNQLQAQEIEMLKRDSGKMDQKSKKSIEMLRQEYLKESQHKVKNVEKIYAQILQMGSVSSHLKDLIRIAEIESRSGNCSKINDYIEMNLESSVRNMTKLVHQLYPKMEHVDSSQSLEPVGNDKVQTRAVNFKKFRESTQETIKQLFNTQLESKKTIIHNLESQLMKVHNESSDQLHEKNKAIKDLESQIKQLHEKYITVQRELDYNNTTIIPKIRDESKYQKEKIQNEFESKEEELRSKVIKQKYQLKEQTEKSKMLENENIQLKIQMEAMRCQIRTLQTNSLQQKVELPPPPPPQPQPQPQPQTLQQPLVHKRTNSTDDLISQQSLVEKFKQQQLMIKIEKKNQLLKNQLCEYKETVYSQAELIKALQRKVTTISQKSQSDFIRLTKSSRLDTQHLNEESEFSQKDNNYIKAHTTQVSHAYIPKNPFSYNGSRDISSFSQSFTVSNQVSQKKLPEKQVNVRNSNDYLYSFKKQTSTINTNEIEDDSVSQPNRKSVKNMDTLTVEGTQKKQSSSLNNKYLNLSNFMNNDSVVAKSEFYDDYDDYQTDNIVGTSSQVTNQKISSTVTQEMKMPIHIVQEDSEPQNDSVQPFSFQDNHELYKMTNGSKSLLIMSDSKNSQDSHNRNTMPLQSPEEN